MIGYLQGEVLFSDGQELVLVTSTGIGYQIYCHHVLAEGTQASLFVTHVKRETSEELFAFKSLREKKLFEMLNKVKGVGPKSAYSLISSLGAIQVIDAITLDSKKTLTKAPGVGPKAAAQMILDLGNKIQKVKMYADTSKRVRAKLHTHITIDEELNNELFDSDESNHTEVVADGALMQDALMACKELGFKEENILPIAQKIVSENSINKPEQLIHLVLKEL